MKKVSPTVCAPRLTTINSSLFASDPAYCSYTPASSTNDTMQSITTKLANTKLLDDTCDDGCCNEGKEHSSPAISDKSDNISEKCVLIIDKIEDLLFYTDIHHLVTKLNKAIEGK